MESITQRERELLEESFSLYDTVGDGKIVINLLGEAIRGLGLNPTEGDVQKMVKELHSSGSKRMSFEEFLPIYQSFATKEENDRKKRSKRDFLECFRVFDKEQNGTITSGELHHVLTSLGEVLTPEQVELLTQGLEKKNGTINIEEFINTVMGG